MNDWETVQFEDEKLPRSHRTYKSIRCLCEPCSKNLGKYGIIVFTSEGNWKKGPYKLLIIRETCNEDNFRGIASLEKAQSLCVSIVERYLKNEIKPKITEMRVDPTNKVAAPSLRDRRKRKKRKY